MDNYLEKEKTLANQLAVAEQTDSEWIFTFLLFSTPTWPFSISITTHLEPTLLDDLHELLLTHEHQLAQPYHLKLKLLEANDLLIFLYLFQQHQFLSISF